MVVIKYVHENIIVENAVKLFREYSHIKGAEKCFVSFEQELKNMEKVYLSRGGTIILAYCEREPVGCVAVKNNGNGSCEMKRLFVKPSFRNQGIAKYLVNEAIKFAREESYRVILLQTIPQIMTNAVRLYYQTGFDVVSEIDGVLKMKLFL